jgi:hypothetical protein
VWFIRCFPYHQKNLGDPGSSRGTLEHIRVGLTGYIHTLHVHSASQVSLVPAVDWDTPCTYIPLVVKGIHPARPYCRCWRNEYPMHVYTVNCR